MKAAFTSHYRNDVRFPKDIAADGSARALNLDNDIVKSHI